MAHRRWPSGLPTPSSSGARSRRTLAPSSEEDSPFRAISISNLKYRVGSPPLLRLPLLTDYHPTGIEVIDSNEDDLLELAGRALRTNAISNPYDERNEDGTDREFAMNLVTRSMPEFPGHGVPTILIIAEWKHESPRTWEQAVKQIKHDANAFFTNLGRPDIELSVEIVAPERFDRTYIGPIIGEERLFEAWPGIRDQVHARLESFSTTRNCVTSVAIFRYGYSHDVATNPITIYIALSYDSDEYGWPPVVEAIKSDLAQRGWSSLNVHVEHNDNKTYAFELLEPKEDIENLITGPNSRDLVIKGDYQSRANLGADISAAIYLKRSDEKLVSSLIGTLGCYLEVKTRSNQTWTKYALTNHHVIRPCFDGFQCTTMAGPDGKTSTRMMDPLPNSPLAQMDAKGAFPNDDSGFPVEHPSRSKHNSSLSMIHTVITKFTAESSSPSALQAAVAPYEKERSDKIAFFDEGKNVLGNVWASSGYKRRSPDNQRLDWALISVRSDRQGENRLPLQAEWAATYHPEDWPNFSTFGNMLQPQGDVSLRYMAPGTAVFKSSAITGARSGVFHRFKADACSISEDKYLGLKKSSQYVCIGKSLGRLVYTDSRFVDKGDSGCAVFDRQGRAVGLLFTGLQPQRGLEGYAYVTPIEDVFEDIKKFAKGGITDIRIAE
jgi:hypothetical protein